MSPFRIAAALAALVGCYAGPASAGWGHVYHLCANPGDSPPAAVWPPNGTPDGAIGSVSNASPATAVDPRCGRWDCVLHADPEWPWCWYWSQCWCVDYRGPQTPGQPQAGRSLGWCNGYTWGLRRDPCDSCCYVWTYCYCPDPYRGRPAAANGARSPDRGQGGARCPEVCWCLHPNLCQSYCWEWSPWYCSDVYSYPQSFDELVSPALNWWWGLHADPCRGGCWYWVKCRPWDPCFPVGSTAACQPVARLSCYEPAVGCGCGCDEPACGCGGYPTYPCQQSCFQPSCAVSPYVSAYQPAAASWTPLTASAYSTSLRPGMTNPVVPVRERTGRSEPITQVASGRALTIRWATPALEKAATSITLASRVRPVAAERARSADLPAALAVRDAGNEVSMEGQLLGDASTRSGAVVWFVRLDGAETHRSAVPDSAGHFQASLGRGEWLVYLGDRERKWFFHGKIDMRDRKSTPGRVAAR